MDDFFAAVLYCTNMTYKNIITLSPLVHFTWTLQLTVIRLQITIIRSRKMCITIPKKYFTISSIDFAAGIVLTLLYLCLGRQK